jgi:large-conductance mechanosensitive channel
MDDTPKHLLDELRTDLLRKRLGQIALAILLGEAALRFVNSLVWYLMIPIFGRVLENHTESVMFEGAMRAPFPFERLFGSCLEFALTIILAFYLNRWIHQKPKPATPDQPVEEYTSVGERIPSDEA